jgi:predicted CXXCH cytochrome family protein
MVPWQLMAASPPINLAFDHKTTGFELDGAHREVGCESCHLNAVFKGTPRDCNSCHSRGTRYNAMPKPATHPLTSDRCAACHSTTAYLPVVKFDHAASRGSCASCHNNIQAIGKSPTHITTTAGCETCHSTAAWRPAAFDHAGVVDNCFSCHNGTRATGKNATHLATTNSCESCHQVNSWQPWTRVDHTQVSGTCVSCHSGSLSTSVGVITPKSSNHIASDNNCQNCHTTVAWVPASFTHAGITANCVSCHNGSSATGKNALHIAASTSCESCHSTTTWMPATRVDHTQVSGTCFSCHDNALIISTGAVPGKTPSHIITDNNCQNCHTTVAFKPATFNHSGITNGCSGCHNGTAATGKTATHIASSSSCQSCHSTVTWKPATRVDHLQVSGTCLSCHNNSVVISTGTVAGKTPTHVVSDNSCQNCHTTVAWKPANFTHNGITGNCISCHNGTTATGRSLTHIASSNGCESCHSVVTWRPATRVNHSLVTGTCLSCHNNALVISTGTVAGKTPTHVASDNNCQNCHTTVAWRPANFTHNGITGNCVSCHNGVTATGKNISHIASSNTCESCHSVVTWKPAVRVDHTRVTGTCLSCHNNALVISTGTVQGKTPTHITSDNNCQNCHTTVAWLPANFTHNGITGNCVSCHNGTAATGKTQTHIATSNTCESCHSVVTWRPATRVDHLQVSGTCLSCHNNSLVISTGTVAGKTPTHVASDNSCQNCHTTIAWRPANFTHNGITGNCVSCHNGTTATGKTSTHITSSNTCESCHSVVTWKPSTRVDHTQVTGTCLSCHNNALVISTGVVQGKTTTHVPADNNCQNCHTTLAWRPATAFSHAGITSGCVSCHNGATATGKNPTHIATTNLCENCHTTTAFRPALRTDHTQVTGTCVSCHSGTVSISTGLIPGKSTAHIATSNSCQSCHTTNAWTPATVDHAQIPLAQQGSCITCHNGTKASGKPGTHIPTTAECGSCHTTLAWKPATFSHTGITTGCSSCHDGVKATGKQDAPAPHFVTTRDCNFCHTTTAWSPTKKYVHVSTNYPGDHRVTINCTNSSCHGGNSEVVTWRTPTYANSCAGCHSGNYKSDPHKKYGNVRYTVSELRNCAGACHIYSDATLTTITTRRNGPQHTVLKNGF